MLPVEDPLGLHQLLVEALERQPGRQHRVLDVEEPVVPRRQLARLGEPRLGARIGRAHRQVDDLGDAQRPLPDHREAALVPVRVGDDVEGNGEAELARDLERLEVLVGSHPLPQQLEPLLVERLHAEEHVVQAEPTPVREDLLVLDEDIAARLEVVLLPDPATLDLAADGEAVLGLDERDVVHEEDVGLADARQVLGRRLRRRLAVAPAVEGPGAAEGAVPGTAARELGGGAGIEDADEVLVAPAHEVARGRVAVEVVEERRARPRPVARHHARQRLEPRVADRVEHARDDHLALAADDAVDGAPRVLEELGGDERGAVAADEDEAVAAPALGRLRQIDDLGHIGEVIHREADDLGPEALELPRVIPGREGLQVEEPDIVPGRSDGGRHPLQPQRLETQVQLRVHQRTGMHEQHSHGVLPRKGPGSGLCDVRCGVWCPRDRSL